MLQKDAGPLDSFALDLQRLRETKGISYSEIALQVSTRRLERGLHEAAARTPRSTVYNCFRTGRVRVDIDLLRDIVVVITGDESEAERWISRYLELRKQSEALRQGSTVAPQRVPHESRREPVNAAVLQPAKLPWQTIILVMGAALLINRIGWAINTFFEFSLFLDMVGTCIVAIVLGPWYAVAIGVSYHGAIYLTSFGSDALFGIVSITGALVWGYGVRHFRMGADLSRFMFLGIITAVACSGAGLAVSSILHSSSDGLFAIGSSTQALEHLGLSFWTALASANIMTSIIDKLLASFIALGVFVFLHRRYSFPAIHMPLVEHLGQLQLTGTGLKCRLKPAFS